MGDAPNRDRNFHPLDTTATICQCPTQESRQDPANKEKRRETHIYREESESGQQEPD